MRIRNIFAVFALLLSVGAAHAVYTVNFNQIGSDVVMTGNGSFDLSGMTTTPGFTIQCPYTGYLSSTVVCIGTDLGPLAVYQNVISPPLTSLKTGASVSGTAAAGPNVVLFDSSLVLPSAYASGTVISSSARFAATTLVSLGLPVATSRTYTLTSGDTIVVNIGTLAPAIPATPASIPSLNEYALMALASVMAMLGMVAARRRRR